MLSLTSPRWAELAQAYGTAEDVPRLIAALGELGGERERAEVWFALWSMLCQRGDVYAASYAAAPYLLAVGEWLPLRERAQAVQLVACIEAYRHRDGAPPVPADLAAAYEAAVSRVPAVVCASAAESRWDPEVAQVLASALLVAKRQPRLGLALLQLQPVVQCPRCGTEFVPGGTGSL